MRDNFDLVCKIVVRPELENQAKAIFPNAEIIACSKARYLFEMMRVMLSGNLLYTPTSHPFPFINRQWIVVHDSYPFEVGPKSELKRFLLKWSLAMSRCRVAYINRSEAKPFVESLGVAAHRTVFAPNQFPKSVNRIAREFLPRNHITTIGLLGTDSEKKNYDELFCAVQKAGLSSFLMFRVYGHDTNYFRKIKNKFVEIQFELARSDYESIDQFMSSVDVLASASEQEGFGRLFAYALLAGLPVELLDRPVFREFFTGGARFHPNLEALVQSLSRVDRCDRCEVSYVAPFEVVEAHALASQEIRRLGSIALS